MWKVMAVLRLLIRKGNAKINILFSIFAKIQYTSEFYVIYKAYKHSLLSIRTVTLYMPSFPQINFFEYLWGKNYFQERTTHTCSVECNMGMIQQGTFNNLKDGCLAFWSLLKSSPFQRFMRLNKILKYYRDHLLAYMPMNHLIPGRESRTLTADSLWYSTQQGAREGSEVSTKEANKCTNFHRTQFHLQVCHVPPSPCVFYCSPKDLPSYVNVCAIPEHSQWRWLCNTFSGAVYFKISE